MTDVYRRPWPARGATAAAPVVVLGAPSPLRSAVARSLGGPATPAACLDSPDQLRRALADGDAAGPGGPGAGALAGGAVVLATVPRLPGLAGALAYRFRPRALAASFEQALLAARSHGVARVIVLSTAFRYADDGGTALRPGSPTLAAPETAAAAAAEAAAGLFSRLGGDSVVLRLGWTCGPEEAVTRRVLSAARRGWRLIDADPDSWVCLVAEEDAAHAVRPAMTSPPGTYNVTDGRPLTAGALNALLQEAAGQALHGLDDPRWGWAGALFGHSRRVAGPDLPGWQPEVTPTAGRLAALLAGGRAASER